MISVDTACLYSGVKRERIITSAFQKKITLNKTYTIKREFVPEPSSPAPKLIKLEYNGETNTLREIFIRKKSDSESSSSGNSPTSSTSSATSTSTTRSATSTSTSRGQHVHGKNNHQSAFAPKNITLPKAFNFNGHPNSPKFVTNSLTQFAFKEVCNSTRFCYNCKTSGHQKFECVKSWSSTWPMEYKNRYRWLKRRIYQANQLRWRKGMMKRYMQEAREIEKEVELADRKRENNFTQYRTGPPPPQQGNNSNGRYWGPAKEREDGQKIVQAKRRVKPPKHPAGCPTQHVDFDKLMKDLQCQINQLRFTLTNVNYGSVSPPN